MKTGSLNKSTYPMLSKHHGTSSSEVNFRDENLRDTHQSDKNLILNEYLENNTTSKLGSEILDNNAFKTNPSSKGLMDSQLLGSPKSPVQLFSTNRSKKLKPIGKSGEGNTTMNGFKPIDFGLSDFYLKNFLAKPKMTPETRKMNSLDYGHGNFGDTSGFKNSNMDHSKTRSPLNRVSAELAQIVQGQGPKQRFFDILAASCKEFYTDKKDFMKIFEDVDVASFCLEEVVERLKCYRFELGSLIDKVGFSFRKIIEKVLELTMKMSSEKDYLHDRKMEENFQGIKALEKEKKALEEKNKQYKNLSDVTESEANIYKFNVKSLQNEVTMLYELLKKDYLIQDQPPGMEEPLTLLPKSLEMNEPSKLLATNLETLDEAIKKLESEQTSKEGKLQEMNNLLKAMLRGGKKEASTQVDEGELAWAAKNIISLEGLKPKPLDFEAHETSAINVDPHLGTKIEKNEELEEVDPIQILKFKEKTEKKEAADSPVVEQPKVPTGKNTNATLPNIPLPSNQAPAEIWSLPLNMIVFLENVTKANKTANVLPWPFFKRIIYEIYQDRLANASEIKNLLLSTSMTMSEYLPIYFLKTYRLRRTAELKLLEFGVSLKYYLKTWQRAATFANICNISNVKVENGAISTSSYPDFDTYAQNFCLFAFSKATSDPASIYDNADGTSYLVKEKVEGLTNEILSFENEANRKKMLMNISKYSKSFTDAGKDIDGVDIDKLLNAYMEVYFEVKARNIQTLTKQFYKLQSTGEGVLSVDEVSQIVNDIIGVESTLNGHSYPKEFTVCRAFMYSLTSGKNTFSVSYKDFIQSVTRFGIDCPFPFIQVPMSITVPVPVQAPSLLAVEDKSPRKINNPSVAKSKVLSPTGKSTKGLESPKNKADDDSSSVGSARFPGIGGEKEGKKKKEDGPNFKIDSTSSLFAQHFSIIRELKGYCGQFKDIMAKESDAQKVWKGFEQIVNVLEAGCQFLSYPVTM